MHKRYTFDAKIPYTDGSGGYWGGNLDATWDGTSKGLKKIRDEIFEFVLQLHPQNRRLTLGSHVQIINMIELWGENS